MPRKGSRTLRKPPGTAVDARNGQKAPLSVIEGSVNPMRFEPPKAIGQLALRQWNDYWDDQVSYLVTPADKMTLVRWIETVDRYFTVMGIADKNPMTRGSTHNDVVNPLYNLGLKMMAEISKLEAQLGIGPKNRAALGIAVLSERRSLQDLNAAFEPDEGANDDGDDPRLKIISGEAGW